MGNRVIGRRASSRISFSAALLAGTAFVASPVLAQDEQPEEEVVDVSEGQGDEIVVDGFRAVVQSSIQEKRNATEVFDALSADEIGDIPALSIGEALETLTGAGSHRENGGATEISIRGLGPFLGSTVINGRAATNGSGDRSVNFSQFPSELFTKIGIYKTQAASYIEGGVAGQIVLETARPIDFGKRRVQGEIKAELNPDNFDIDSDQRLNDVGYRGSLSFIDQWSVGDGELGLSLGYERRDSNNPEQEVRVSNTIRACVVDPSTTTDGVFDDGNCDTSSSTIDGLRDGSVDLPFVIARNSYALRQNLSADTRNAFFGAIQYQPSPNVDINADFQYSTRKQSEQRSDLNFAEGRRIDEQDAANSIPGFDLLFTESGALRQFTSEQRIEAVSEFLERDEEYYGGGLSIDFSPADRLTISLDGSYSQTRRIEEAVQVRFRTEDDEDIFGNTGAFTPSVENDGSTQDDRVESVIQIFQNGSEGVNFVVQDFDVDNHNLFANDPRVRADLEQDRFNSIWAVRGDVAYELDGFFSLFQAGTRYQELVYRDVPGAQLNTSRLEFGQSTNNPFSDNPIDPNDPRSGALATANQECRTSFPESGFLSSISGGNPLVTQVDASGNVVSTTNTFATFDARCIVQVLERVDPQGLPLDEDGNVIFPTGEFDSIQNTDVTERTWAGYVQADFDGELGQMPIRGNVGVRVVDTSVRSRGFRAALNVMVTPGDPLDPTDNGQFVLAQDNTTLVSEVFENSYTEFLPSVNLVAEFQPELLGRFAVYRSLSRPDPSSLGNGRFFSTNNDEFATAIDALNGGIDQVTATGNPATEPLLSWNVDAGLEWYPNDDTILAFNAYYKSFDGGFETVGQFEPFSISGQDVDLLVTQVQVNDDTSTIFGLEVTAAHRFSYLPAPLDGLGFKLSYNYADSNFEFEDDTLGALTTLNPDGTTSVSNGLIPPSNLFGFSEHVLSAQAYYEIGDFDFQGIYKYRSDYFQQFVTTPGRIRFVDDVSVFEARITYALNDNLRFSLEGLNLFNQPRTDFRGAADDLGQVLVFGPRFFAGVRARF
ncbi:MAG: TonB-dependent receptor [Erythrobacter sp.]|uniref:TonB-dependent receptor n=1 Tax=Erythrobacter sp. TaxID=1042 RepID=UPI003298F209